MDSGCTEAESRCTAEVRLPVWPPSSTRNGPQAPKVFMRSVPTFLITDANAALGVPPNSEVLLQFFGSIPLLGLYSCGAYWCHHRTWHTRSAG